MPITNLKNLERAGELIADFGLQPVSNRFLAIDSDEKVPQYPLQLRVDLDTGLIHQGKPFPVDELKPHYDWLTCYEPEDHLDELVEKLTRLPGVTKSSLFGAYSFKDDTTLARLARLGYTNIWCIDPVQDLGVLDACANVETYQAAFTLDKATAIRQRRGAADVLIVRHVIEHAYDLPAFIEAIKCMLSPGGYIVWEAPDCEQALDAGDCTTIWEEHIFYFTRFTFKQLLLKAGFTIDYFDSVSYPLGDSLIAIVREASTRINADGTKQELALELARTQRFTRIMEQRRIGVRDKLLALRDKYGPIAIFGAGHLSVTFLSLMGVVDLISLVVDDNPNKSGLKMPVGELKIVGADSLYSSDVAVCLLGFNPQIHAKVIAKHTKFIERGGVFASIFPDGELYLESVS